MRAMQEPLRARSLAFHPNAPAIVRFDPFRFDLAEGSLWRDGAEVRLPPRSMVILQHLVERAGAIVAKQALIDAGWKDAHVGEASLTEAIGILRQALDDDPQQPRYIQTVHRRGYRFIAPIAVDAPTPHPLRDATPQPALPLTPTGAPDARGERVGVASLSPQAGRGSAHPLAPEGGEGRVRGVAREESAAPDLHAGSPESNPTTAPLPSASSAVAEGTASHVGAAARVTPRGRGTMRPAAVAAIVVVVAILATAAWWLLRGEVAPPPVARLTLTLTPEQAPAPGLNAHPVAAMTPDGQRVIYTAGTVGAQRLFVRRMDRVEATPLPGTDGGHGPFVSPDGRWVGFFANGALRKVPIDGGEPQVICTVPTGVGGTWLSDEEIVFAPDWTSPLMRVRASSGSEPKLAAAPKAGYSYRWPDRIDNHTVIATRWHSSARDAAVVALSLTPAETEDPRDDDDVEKVIAKTSVFARYVPSGHLLFVRDGTVHSVAFDAASRTATSAPVQVAHSILTGMTGAAQLAISPTGTMLSIADVEERSRRVMSRVDAASAASATSSASTASNTSNTSDATSSAAAAAQKMRMTELPIAPRAFRNFSVCGDRLAAMIHERGQSELWVGSLDRAALTRITGEGTASEPAWKQGCETITFGWNRTGASVIHDVTLGKGEPPRALREDRNRRASQIPGSWSADGRLLAYVEPHPITRRGDIWILDTSTGRTRALIATPAEEILPRLSPDGRWIAYESDASGRFEVEIASVEFGARLQVSTNGGTWPAWSANGRDLFYLHDGTIYRVPVDGSGSGITGGISAQPSAGNPVSVFHHPDIVLFRPAADGGFVVIRRTGEHLPLTRLDLVLNWRAP
jgi:DNA-binding winged helix-turn-helix (wHTH) protein/Tol biopolymer transport system component